MPVEVVVVVSNEQTSLGKILNFNGDRSVTVRTISVRHRVREGIGSGEGRARWLIRDVPIAIDRYGSSGSRRSKIGFIERKSFGASIHVGGEIIDSQDDGFGRTNRQWNGWAANRRRIIDAFDGKGHRSNRQSTAVVPNRVGDGLSTEEICSGCVEELQAVAAESHGSAVAGCSDTVDDKVLVVAIALIILQHVVGSLLRCLRQW